MDEVKTVDEALQGAGYQIVYLLDEKTPSNSVLDVFKSIGAKIIRTKDLGVRALAYEIKKRTSARYFWASFDISPESLKELEEKMKLEANPIRFLITKKLRQTEKMGGGKQAEAKRAKAKEKREDQAKKAIKVKTQEDILKTAEKKTEAPKTEKPETKAREKPKVESDKLKRKEKEIERKEEKEQTQPKAEEIEIEKGKLDEKLKDLVGE